MTHMTRKIRLVPGQPPVLPKKSRLLCPYSSETPSAKDTVLAYLGTAFFKDADGDKGYWGALVVDPRRPEHIRIREACGSCDVSHDYDCGIAAIAALISSISDTEGIGRPLKLYAPRGVVDEMHKWKRGWRLKTKWREVQERCVAYGPIAFHEPVPGGYTGPRIQLAKGLARRTAAEDGVVVAVRSDDDADA